MIFLCLKEDGFSNQKKMVIRKVNMNWQLYQFIQLLSTHTIACLMSLLPPLILLFWTWKTLYLWFLHTLTSPSFLPSPGRTLTPGPQDSLHELFSFRVSRTTPISSVKPWLGISWALTLVPAYFSSMLMISFSAVPHCLCPIRLLLSSWTFLDP